MPDREIPKYDPDAFRAAFVPALVAGAGPLGLVLTPEVRERLLGHAWAVYEANREINLTAITGPADMAVRHTLDSLVPHAIWPEAVGNGGDRALDLGSGAGYPGIPLATVRPDLAVTLVDATRKKVERLARFAADLPRVETWWGRIEDLAGGTERVDRVWVRAVGPLPVLVELAFGALKPGGWLVAWKGMEAVGSEWEAGARAARALGGWTIGLKRYVLPGSGDRYLMVFERGERALPRGVPRPAAIIRRHPLA